VLKVLVACEFSGVVRDAFRARGHDAWSCDLLPSERPGPHIQGDVLEVLDDDWDVMVAHPPCRFLTRAADWLYRDTVERAEAVAFVEELWDAPIPRIAIENPRGLNRVWQPASQVIQPWHFGHEERKTTLLWLKNLPPLLATRVMERYDRNLTPSGQNRLGPSGERWRERSRTYCGVAEAMADQWGAFAEDHRRLYHDPRDLEAEPCCSECCECSNHVEEDAFV
jgi:hypothetical protein